MASGTTWVASWIASAHWVPYGNIRSHHFSSGVKLWTGLSAVKLISCVPVQCRSVSSIAFCVISYKKFSTHSTPLTSPPSWGAFFVYMTSILWLLQWKPWAISIIVIYFSDFPLCLLIHLSIVACGLQYLMPNSWILNSVSIWGMNEWIIKGIKLQGQSTQK